MRFVFWSCWCIPAPNQNQTELTNTLFSAAKVNIHSYHNTYANDHTISFMPAVTNTSCTVSFSIFCSYRHTVRRRNTLTVLVCQRNLTVTQVLESKDKPCSAQLDKHTALYGVIKCKLGLAFAKAAAMCVIMHIDKSPAILMGRPARSSQQYVPCLLSSVLHHSYHLPTHHSRGP